jgi:hypothetical protein
MKKLIVALLLIALITCKVGMKHSKKNSRKKKKNDIEIKIKIL